MFVADALPLRPSPKIFFKSLNTSKLKPSEHLPKLGTRVTELATIRHLQVKLRIWVFESWSMQCFSSSEELTNMDYKVYNPLICHKYYSLLFHVASEITSTII